MRQVVALLVATGIICGLLVAMPTAKANRQQWEYMAKRLKPPKNDKWKQRWNDLGKEGWELSARYDNYFIFKRPSIKPIKKPQTPKPAQVEAQKQTPQKEVVQEEKKPKKKPHK